MTVKVQTGGQMISQVIVFQIALIIMEIFIFKIIQQLKIDALVYALNHYILVMFWIQQSLLVNRERENV